jgi:hypothetical protein
MTPAQGNVALWATHRADFVEAERHAAVRGALDLLLADAPDRALDLLRTTSERLAGFSQADVAWVDAVRGAATCMAEQQLFDAPAVVAEIVARGGRR